MSASEDESQTLDAGWDDDEVAEDEVDQAWDSVSPPVTSAAPSMAPATEEVDSGWDDVPVAGSLLGPGKRRPHRKRRAKTNAPVAGSSPLVTPRPAEPSKKHQREHARKQRAHEARLKQERKQERKTQRAAEARKEEEQRLRQAEADERARKARREARERVESERPLPRPAASKAPRKQAKTSPAVSPRSEPVVRAANPKRGLRPAVMVTLLLLVLGALLLLARK